MRLKKYSLKQKIVIRKKIKLICKKNNVKFIINDDPTSAKKLDADGCHLGQKDMGIEEARKLLKYKIIGITCHNSISLAKEAIKKKADYIAFGSFFSTKTKKIKHYADNKTLKWSNKNTQLPIVAIGGINNLNYSNLIKNGADLIALSSFIWKKRKPSTSIKLFKKIKNYI